MSEQKTLKPSGIPDGRRQLVWTSSETSDRQTGDGLIPGVHLGPSLLSPPAHLVCVVDDLQTRADHLHQVQQEQGDGVDLQR